MHQIDYTWYWFQSPELPFPLPILGFRRAVDAAAHGLPSELLEGIEYDTAYGCKGISVSLLRPSSNGLTRPQTLIPRIFRLRSNQDAPTARKLLNIHQSLYTASR